MSTTDPTLDADLASTTGSTGPTGPTSRLRRHGWRVALSVSGIAMLAGGPQHPSADAKDSLSDELATMTADPAWVPAHALVVVSTILLAVGLVAAYRTRAWPVPTRRALGIAAVTVCLYTVETVFHLAAVVDSDALAHGETAPVATVHILLSIVLYPVTGVAVVLLAVTQLMASRGLRRLVAVPGVAFGTLHALAVPLTLLLPTAEITPVFAGAAISSAIWALATAAAGAPREGVRV